MLFVLGPWLFVVLMLIGPFVLLFTLVLAAMIFVAVAGGMCVLPYLLVRHLRKPWSLSSAVPPPDRRSRAMSTHPHKPMSHRTECD